MLCDVATACWRKLTPDYFLVGGVSLQGGIAEHHARALTERKAGDSAPPPVSPDDHEALLASLGDEPRWWLVVGHQRPGRSVSACALRVLSEKQSANVVVRNVGRPVRQSRSQSLTPYGDGDGIAPASRLLLTEHALTEPGFGVMSKPSPGERGTGSRAGRKLTRRAPATFALPGSVSACAHTTTTGDPT